MERKVAASDGDGNKGKFHLCNRDWLVDETTEGVWNGELERALFTYYRNRCCWVLSFLFVYRQDDSGLNELRVWKAFDCRNSRSSVLITDKLSSFDNGLRLVTCIISTQCGVSRVAKNWLFFCMAGPPCELAASVWHNSGG